MGTRIRIAVAAIAFVLSAADAAARTAQPPLAVELQFDGSDLVWSLRAEADVRVRGLTWRGLPSGIAPPTFAAALAAGAEEHGRIRFDNSADAWVELRVDAAAAAGSFTVGAATRRRPASRVAPARTALPAERPHAVVPGTVRGRFLYEARIVDRQGYTGAVRRLPLRHVEAELIAESTGLVAAHTRTDADGRFVFPTGSMRGAASVRLRSTTGDHPDYALRVLEPDPQSEHPGADARSHELRTAAFTLDPGGVELGTFVERDRDGFGAVQAFHILDVAIDAFDALGSAAFPGPRPTREDALRIFWGPSLRIRFSAQARDIIEITSPGSGDTDGWSDAVILHEVGHFVAQRFLRESSPGGIHLLGDVEQDLRLAWAEGLATAFACWVRDWRAGTRRDADGRPVDADVARYVNVGLPPPDGQAGGLQFAWDVEAHRLGNLDLPRDGIGSETTVAGVLWDAADAPASADAAPGDDDPVAVGPARVWAALRALRAMPASQPITFEDFWIAWREQDPDPDALDALLRDARIEFEPDAAEPDGERAPALFASRPQTTEGGIVINEIALGALIAIEIANRGKEPHLLGGWSLVARANSSSGAPSLTYTLPPGTRIGAGGRLVVHRGGGGPASARDVVATNWTTPWFPGFEGAVELRDASGRAVDFVRWDGRDGVRSTVPPPAGTAFEGALAAAPFGQVLARRELLPDRDVAADFIAAPASLGAPNDVPAVHRTFFPALDTDVLQWEVRHAGVYTVEVRRPRNGAEPRLEVRIPGSALAITHVATAASSRVPARVTLQLEAGTMLEAHTRHIGRTTRFGTYDIALFAEPDARIAFPPTGLAAELDRTGALPRLHLGWWNAGTYDALRVRAGDGEWQPLPATARQWTSGLGTGLQRVALEADVAGAIAAAPVLAIDADAWLPARAFEFAPGFEPDWILDSGWTRTETAGSFQGALSGATGAAWLWRAVVPEPGARFEFTHICAAPPERGAVLELTADWGATWDRLGRWDWNAVPGSTDGAPDWRDGSADPDDWVREEIALEAWAGRPVQLRFRLVGGAGDGWHVDALRVTAPAAPALPFTLRFYPAEPNPFNPTTRLRFELSHASDVRLELFDVRGRMCRVLVRAPFGPGTHAVDWDGRDGAGQPVASGVYFARIAAGDTRATHKLVLLR